jgi:hypothetical protein
MVAMRMRSQPKQKAREKTRAFCLHHRKSNDGYWVTTSNFAALVAVISLPDPSKIRNSAKVHLNE